MNLEPKSYTNPYAFAPPCQTPGCGHEWFEHEYAGDDAEAKGLNYYDKCMYCACRRYREERLERDEAEGYDW